MSSSTRTSGSSYGGQSFASAASLSMSSSTRTSGSSYVGQSFASAVSRSTQTYFLPSKKAVCGAQLGARNRNLGGVANLNVNLPNRGYYNYYPIVWQPLANSWVKANSAGLISNGNPSVTTCGGLFWDSSGKFMGGFSQNLHVETSYFAEVIAAFLVIELAYHKGWKNLWLETDSPLVVHLLKYRDVNVLNLPLNLRQKWSKWIYDVQAKLLYMNFNFTCTFRENNRAAIFMAEIGRHRPEFNWWNWWNIPDHEDLVKIPRQKKGNWVASLSAKATLSCPAPRNSNFGGVANLNVNLPNPQQKKGNWVASLSAKETLSCPAPRNSNFGGVTNLNINLPNPRQRKGNWVASLSAKATLSCPAPAPAPASSTGIVRGLQFSWLKLVIIIQGSLGVISLLIIMKIL
ncbi:hypothetical protein LWI29_011132 [Acer saccharum]|uniref:RNase H type-1 domain-containing protein n=1 Tax=Acer saccharum TaxID=4024 RepID=A0AA39W1B9_ACESA|nr:hypothetical protein LWI29_011132 [Acer saccharum]